MVIFAPAAKGRPAVGMMPAEVRDGAQGQVCATPPARPVGAGGAATPVGGGGGEAVPAGGGGATPEGGGGGALPAGGGARGFGTTATVLVTITGAPVEVRIMVVVIAAPPFPEITEVTA
jgi:hypothetical protein